MKCHKFRRLREKMRSTAGESLVEVLIALLIAAAAILMLGQSVSASVNMIRNSGRAMEDYYAAANILAERPADVENSSVTSGMASVSITCTWDGEAMPDDVGLDPDVRYYVNLAGGEKVVSYGIAN